MGIRTQPRKLNAQDLWDYALKALGRRAHSVHELRQKLRRRAENVADVDLALSNLREYGLADDRRFSETFASSRLENDGFGSGRVIRELRAKRVPDAIAAEVVAGTYSGTDELELTEAFLRRKYRNQNLPELLGDPKKLASVYRRLRTAGFSSGISLTVLKRYSKLADYWEEPPESEEEEAENLRDL